MEDYKPTIGGSVVRNGNMIDNYVKNNPDDNVFLVNLEGKKYDRISDEAGVKVIRCKNLKDQIATCRKIVREKNIDIIHAHNFRFLLVAYLARKSSSQKIIFEIHALYRMSKPKELLSYWLLKKMDRIIVLADSAKKYLIENKGISPEKIVTIRNGSNEVTHFLQSEGKNELYSLLKAVRADGKLVVSYNGSFISWQGVNLIADYFDALLGIHDDIVILMIGDGQEFEYVRQKKDESQYKERIILHQGISKQEMISLYEQIDIVLIPREKSLKTDTAVPLKAIEAMQYNKCILASGDEGIKEVLNADNSMVYKPGDVHDLIEKLMILAKDGSLRERLGKQAAIDAGKYIVSWDKNSKKVREIYSGL